MWSSRHLAAAVTLAVAAVGVPSTASAAGPSPAPAVPCEGSIGVALVDVPQARQADPRARTYVIDHVLPGARLERRIRVCNGTSAPVEVQLYAGAAQVTGTEFRAVEGRVDNELSRWIAVQPGRVTVPADGETLATARIAVPGRATGGERYAAILVEAPAVRQAGGLSVANRVGVRVYLSVGGAAEPRSDFVIDTLQAGRTDDGRPQVTARVRNTGERALDLRGELQLSEGPGGLSAGPFDATVGTTLLPGSSGPVAVPLDPAISGGPWTATLTLRSGLLERRARATITFPDAAGERAAPVPAQSLSPVRDPDLVVPFAIGLLALLALLLLLTALLASRRRGRVPAVAG